MHKLTRGREGVDGDHADVVVGPLALGDDRHAVDDAVACHATQLAEAGLEALGDRLLLAIQPQPEPHQHKQRSAADPSAVRRERRAEQQQLPKLLQLLPQQRALGDNAWLDGCAGLLWLTGRRRSPWKRRQW